MSKTTSKGSKSKSTKSIVLLAILSIVVAIVTFFSFVSFKVSGTIYDYKSVVETIKLGIDLEGGVYVVLSPEKAENDKEFEKKIDNCIMSIRKRLDTKGYTEATITKQGSNIRVEIPSVDDPDEVFNIIGSTGKLTFQNSKEADAKVYCEGSDIEEAYVASGEDNVPVVSITFKKDAIKKFEIATTECLNKPLYIMLDGEEVSAPNVNSTISNGKTVIENKNWTYDEAKNLAMLISSGSLDMELTQSEVRTISSSLGETALKGGLIAGAIGLLLVMLFMAFVYKGLGFLADYALLIYVLLLLMALAFLPWVQLTLAGIAGVILSIGMAVDANVIIFERIKEEYRNGKTVEAAIKTGFKKATIAILDSNITTLIAAIVLWLLGTGSVKGFAITFFLGIIISMFTALIVTRFLIKLFLPLSKKREKFLGLKREEDKTNA